MEIEHKYSRLGDDVDVSDGHVISGYASVFGVADQGNDVVQAGAYAASLAALKAKGGSVKMLWQHDPAQPIGVWDEVREDAKGLWVKGRILTDLPKGREAACLLAAKAIDGLSIGYRAVKSRRNDKGQRLLDQLDLWEVSLVTFPMLPDARVGAKGSDMTDAAMRDVAAVFREAAQALSRL